MSSEKIYNFVNDICETMDYIYEDYLVRLIGENGLKQLRDEGLIEKTGTVDGKQTWKLIERR